MNAPTIWIIAPAIIAILLMPLQSQRALSFMGGLVAVLLALFAQFVPMEQAIRLGTFSFRIESSLDILGRQLLIQPQEGPLLALIYGATALWFFGAEASRSALRLVPIGMLITTLMVAAIAVEPFSLCSTLHRDGGFVVCPASGAHSQTARPRHHSFHRLPNARHAVYPFIWLAAGRRGSQSGQPDARGSVRHHTRPRFRLSIGDLSALQLDPPAAGGGASVHDRIPALDHPRHHGRLRGGFYRPLFLAPHIARIGYSAATCRIAHARDRRIMGSLPKPHRTDHGIRLHRRDRFFPACAQSGYDIGHSHSVVTPPGPRPGTRRMVSFADDPEGTIEHHALQQCARHAASRPLCGRGTGPCIAFHQRIPPARRLSGAAGTVGWSCATLPRAAFWMGIGLVGLFTASFRTLAVLSMADEYAGWEVGEDWLQAFMLGLGMFGLFILGLFPQVAQYFLVSLPSMFEHLGP
jgi:hypothetical protein